MQHFTSASSDQGLHRSRHKCSGMTKTSYLSGKRSRREVVSSIVIHLARAAASLAVAGATARFAVTGTAEGVVKCLAEDAVLAGTVTRRAFTVALAKTAPW